MLQKMMLIALGIMLTTSGCAKENKQLVSSISYLVSTDKKAEHCNGDNMDSDGFKKSITQLVTKSIEPQYLTKEELIRMTIIMASEDSHANQITSNNAEDFLTIKGDSAYIMPIDGWAGISIFMCEWQPLVEVNLLRFPEIKKVVWQ